MAHAVFASLVLLWIKLEMVFSAPCCAPKQWVAEVRVITMETTRSSFTQKKHWYWVSYDYDKQRVAIITFDFFDPNVYQRELLDYAKGVRYVTPDEFKCWKAPLQSSLQRMCVPPPGGNITLDFRLVFGFYDENYEKGMYAESFLFNTSNSSGQLTVASLTCSFVNEMTYTTMDDGSLFMKHTQWNNITLDVNPENFNMPSTCNMTTPTLEALPNDLSPLNVLASLWS